MKWRKMRRHVFYIALACILGTAIGRLLQGDSTAFTANLALFMAFIACHKDEFQ